MFYIAHNSYTDKSHGYIYTDASSRHCAVGFLKNESLQLIVDAPRNNRIHRTLDFRQNTTQSMQINESGLLMRFLIAAKFNHTISSGWPVLQIRRRKVLNDNSSYEEQIATTQEPTPTGYLNVFEYDMQAMAFKVKHDDIIRVYWPPDATPNRSRYSLAYFRDSSNVMVLIEIQHHNQTIITSQGNNFTTKPLITTIGSSYSNTTEIIATTKVSTNSSMNSKDQDRPGNVATIIGGVLCTIAVLFIVYVVHTITVFVVYRYRNHKKDTKHSLVATEETQHAHNIELDSNQAYVTNSETKLSDALECLEMDTNQAYITHSEAKHAGAMESIEMDANHVHIISSEAKLEQGTGAMVQESIEMDLNEAYITHSEAKQEQGAEYVEMETNQAYITSTVPTEPNVVYSTQPPQVHDYEYVALT